MGYDAGRDLLRAEAMISRAGCGLLVLLATAGGLACRPADAQVGLPLADQPLASPKADAPTDPWAIERM